MGSRFFQGSCILPIDDLRASPYNRTTVLLLSLPAWATHMPSRSNEIDVNPAVLRWARESAGWTASEVAAELARPPEFVEALESGEAFPSLTILRVLASKYRRPLGALLLREPPNEPPLPRDFRRRPGGSGSLSKDTRLAIRRARRLQGVARDLMTDLGHPPKPRLRRVDVDEPADQVAALERDTLGIGIHVQFSWTRLREAFGAWSGAVESRNILVFKMPMPVEDCRGFSLNGTGPATIVVSSSDSANARIFTLFHEYAHHILRTPGICVPETTNVDRGQSDTIERWCDEFAGAFLVPRDELSRQVEEELSRAPGNYQRLLSRVAAKFKVSPEVILRRMRKHRLISVSDYSDQLQVLGSRPINKAPFFSPQPPERRILEEKGKLFTSLVLEGGERELIPYSDVAEYLAVQLRHLDAIQASLS